MAENNGVSSYGVPGAMQAASSTHGQERMDERGITPQIVQHVIRTGVGIADPKGDPDVMHHMLPDPADENQVITVVRNHKKNTILTTYRNPKGPEPTSTIESRMKEKVEKEQRTKSNKKDQLAKKRARTPKPNK